MEPDAFIARLTVTARFKEKIPIFKVKKSNLYDLVDVCDIKEKCMFVEVDDHHVFVCRFPCKILTD